MVINRSLKPKGVQPSGEINITENGTYNVINYASAVVNVPSSMITNKLPSVVDKSVTTITSQDLDGASNIGDNAFSYCSNLTSIAIPNSVTSIGEYAFQNCSSLTSIAIPISVTYIGSYSFIECISLENIIIPENVSVIRTHTFYMCNNLTTITIEATVPPVLEDMDSIPFTISAIEVPMDSVEAYKTATNWSNFADKIIGYEEIQPNNGLQIKGIDIITLLSGLEFTACLFFDENTGIYYDLPNEIEINNFINNYDNATSGIDDEDVIFLHYISTEDATSIISYMNSITIGNLPVNVEFTFNNGSSYIFNFNEASDFEFEVIDNIGQESGTFKFIKDTAIAIL